MPKLPCPYGARCEDGPQGAIWETIVIDFAEAKSLLDDHQKSHQFTVSPANNTALKQKRFIDHKSKQKIARSRKMLGNIFYINGVPTNQAPIWWTTQNST